MVKKVLIVIAAIGAVTVSVYLTLRWTGLEIRTSVDAFSIPAGGNQVYTNTDGNFEVIIDITPAPWPPESAWIFQLAQIGIPVHVILDEAPHRMNFVIVGVNRGGHLVVMSKKRLEAEKLLMVLGR